MLLGPINQDGKFHQAIKGAFNWQRIFSQTDNWYQDEIDCFDFYFQQRPSQLKNTIKRKQKKLLASHHVDTKIITKLEDFLLHFSDYQTIYQQSWKGAEGNSEFIEAVCRHAIKNNKFRMGILLVDGVAAAAQIWFLEKKSASIFKLAYDPNFKQYSVGSILSMALSQYVIEQDKVEEIEFGMGNEPYKKDWMSKKRCRVTLEVFNPKSINGLLSSFKYLFLAKVQRFLLRK